MAMTTDPPRGDGRESTEFGLPAGGAFDERPDPAFDDLVAVISQLTGGAVACVVDDLDRHWCKARPGDLPESWGPEGPGRPMAASVAVSGANDRVIGHIDVFDDRPLTPSTSAVLGVFAELVARLLEEHRPGTWRFAPPWGVVVVGAEGQLRAVSPRFAHEIGWDPDELVGRDVFELVHADDHAVAVESLARTAAFPGEKYPLDLRFVGPDGAVVLLEVTAVERVDPAVEDIVFVVRGANTRTGSDAFVSGQTRVLGMIAGGSPIEQTLAQLADLAAQHLATSVCIMLVDEHDTVVRPVAWAGLPTAFTRAIDRAPIGPASITSGVVAHRNQADRSADIRIDPTWAAQSEVAVEAELVSCWSTPIRSSVTSHAIGTLDLYAADDTPLRAEDVRVADLCAVIAGVAIQRSVVEDVLMHRAMHDPLTGLANRALFLDRLSHALSLRPDPCRYTAVMFLDLDRFKVVNDALGHDAGDEILKAVARRLTAATRTSATVARLGGDEFTVLCEGLRSPRDAVAIATRLVQSLRDPVPLADGGFAPMSVSVGVAVSNGPDDQPESLLRDADAAMYRAKDRGRNRVEVFDDGMRAAALARLDLEHALADAIERGDFTLVFQPAVDLSSGSVVAAEALLRWHQPDQSVVAAVEFIPIVEEMGAIVPLGDWVINEVCTRAVQWTAGLEAERPFQVWVNISGPQLLQHAFPDRVREIIELTGFSPQRLGLEVTESALMTDADAAIDAVAALRELGVSVAIDHFGTGHASLSYLKRLPVDVVKIDRSFIDDIGRSDEGVSMVAAIAQLAHAMGCQVVADGVESPAQYESLASLGCDIAQGHGVGLPVAVTTPMPTWLTP
ncbi:MAG TPA: GGDEF domain-containing protein [Ilumatobacteraceae bacterium]